LTVLFKLHKVSCEMALSEKHKFSPHLYKKDWYYEKSEKYRKNAIFLRLIASLVTLLGELRSYFILWAICNATVAGCSIISTHSMYKIKPRQFIIRFRNINTVKCNKDVNDFNSTSITTSNRYFLQTSLLPTLHINLVQKKCIISKDFEVRMLYLYTQRSQNLLTEHRHF